MVGGRRKAKVNIKQRWDTAEWEGGRWKGEKRKEREGEKDDDRLCRIHAGEVRATPKEFP